jgi:formamidopyrimidine-DNA glycosylase
MFEVPEVRTQARQAESELIGRRIASPLVSPTRPRFLFVSPEPPAFSEELTGRTIERIFCSGKSLRAHLDTGAILVVGETGGRFQLHENRETLPKKIHWQTEFDDGRLLTLTIQMWGFLALMTGEEQASHSYLGSDGPNPLDSGLVEFTHVVQRAAEQSAS